jgi:long-chain acyl-CoA synthetase
MERVWLKHYPTGILPEVDLDEFASLVDVLQTSCRRFAELPAFSALDGPISPAALQALISADDDLLNGQPRRE